MSSSLAPGRWLRLMPIVFITYSLAYVDRANYSFGAASGMAKDLHISDSASSLLGALFFLGYFFFQIPGAHYAEKRSARRLIFWSLIAWGVLASAIGVISDIGLLYVIRFLLGSVESVIMPALLVFLSHWFIQEERSRANTFLILGNPITVLWMSVVSGYLVHAVGWRGMFIAEGVPSIIWAFVWWWMVRDRPANAEWLAADAKERLAARLADEQRGLKPVKNYGEAFRTPTVILLALQYGFWSIGVYGFILWLPSILHAGKNINIVDTGWLSAAPYLLAAILMVATSFASDRLKQRKHLVWPFLLVGAICFYGSYLIGARSYWWSFALLVVAGGSMYAPYGPFFALIPEVLPSNVAGGAMALINSVGALGSFVGSYIVGLLNGATGNPDWSYAFMAVSLVLAVIFTLLAPGPKRAAAAPGRPGHPRGSSAAPSAG